MRIGVVSDTHGHDLPEQMLQDFKAVDFIIHAGDIGSRHILKRLEDIAEVKAVYGNMDDAQMQSSLPRVNVFKFGKFSIGIFHGFGAQHLLMSNVKKEFKDIKVDVIIFGHSHHPLNKLVSNILFFNPGSPNDNIFAPYKSYGILEIGDTVVGKIVKIE